MVSEKKIFEVFPIKSLWELYKGMVAILIYGLWRFIQICNPLLTQSSTWSLKKFGPGISKKSFKGVNGWTEGWRTGSDHNSSSWAKKQLSILHVTLLLDLIYEGPAKSFVTRFGLLQCYVLSNIFLLQNFKVFPPLLKHLFVFFLPSREKQINSLLLVSVKDTDK